MDTHVEQQDARSDEKKVYRYGSLYRGLAYGAVGIAVLVLASAGMVAATEGLSEVNWGACAGAAAGIVGIGVSFPVLLSELHLTADRLRKEWPFRADQEVRLGEVRRVFVGGTSVEVYVSSDADPALAFDRKVHESDELIENLVGRLPASAEVDHPSGELTKQLERA